MLEKTQLLNYSMLNRYYVYPLEYARGQLNNTHIQ